MLHRRIKEVTERVVNASKVTRTAYLERMSHAKTQTRVRTGLGCGNLAHVMAACSPGEKDLLKDDVQPNLAIINSYNDMLSAHVPYKDYPDLIKSVANKYNATVQVAGGVPAMCDGVTQGRDGMELSLFLVMLLRCLQQFHYHMMYLMAYFVWVYVTKLYQVY